jgi:hypothetical protein
MTRRAVFVITVVLILATVALANTFFRVDERSGARIVQWQETFAAYLVDMHMRTFAVEYQPYCSDRVRGIQSFLGRFSFRCHPDSGFVFLMMNHLACAPSECSTCSISH